MKRTFKQIVISLLILYSPYVYALTLAQIKTEIRIRIKDSNTSKQRYTDAQLLNIINESQREVINASWIIKVSTTFNLVNGTTYYSLPPDIMQIHRVTFQNQNLPETTLQDLDSRFNYADWFTTGGYPQNYYQDPSRQTQIGIYPWPNSSQSTGTIVMIYYAQATDLSGDADQPFNGTLRYQPYADLLIYEPCYKIFLIEGEGPKAVEYKAYYDGRLGVAIADIGNKPNFNPGFSSQRK